jgi:hypothetical protein
MGSARAAELAEPGRASHSGEVVLGLEGGMSRSPPAVGMFSRFFGGRKLAVTALASSLRRLVSFAGKLRVAHVVDAVQ